MEVILVLHNIRSTYNVGAIIRTAEGFGIFEVVFSGYTPRVHDQHLLPHLREKLDKEIHKTALGAEEMVKITNLNSANELKDWFLLKKAEKYKIVGLENNLDKGKNVCLVNDHDLGEKIGKKVCLINERDLGEKLGEKVVLVLGEEVNGISPELYNEIDLFLEIPMKGKKESFNVSVAAGVAMYRLTNEFI